MKFTSRAILSIAFATIFSSAVASPHGVLKHIPHKIKKHTKACVVRKSKTHDDTDNVLATFHRCKSHSTITFKKDITYTVTRPIEFLDFNDVKLKLDGSIYVPYNHSQYPYEGEVYNTSSKSFFFF